MRGFKLSSQEVPSGYVTIEATSLDTIHSIGVFESQGRLIATVMVMRGRREVVTLYLKPGEYAIRCLEFCGDGHAFMK